MRTTEERAALIQKRTAELKQKEQKKQQQLRTTLCTAACFLLIVGLGIQMPHLIQRVSVTDITHTSGAASLIGGHAALGYILMGLFCFLLGVTLTVLLYQIRKSQENKKQENRDEF